MKIQSRGRFLAVAAAGLSIGGTIHAAPAAADGHVMDVVNERPDDWETPLEELGRSFYTPNRTFFIRSHMGPPPVIDPNTWRLEVGGLVRKPLRLSLSDLKRMPRAEVPAVLQCSGNGRYLFGSAYPGVSHPAGAQWTYGAVGNARWAGVRVRDVLGLAGILPEARFANNFGLDNPLFPATPKFVRGIELGQLVDHDAIFAYEMNGEPLPYFHGYPLRLVVPGWAGDHWVKWFTNIMLSAEITDNVWTANAYRYPDRLGAAGALIPAPREHPLRSLNVKSIITSPLEGEHPRAGVATLVRGFAWSGDGASVARVDLSANGGRTWRPAQLAMSTGSYSWRSFSMRWIPNRLGRTTLLARATDDRGSVQPAVSPWNPGGYLWNGMHHVNVEVR